MGCAASAHAPPPVVEPQRHRLDAEESRLNDGFPEQGPAEQAARAHTASHKGLARGEQAAGDHSFWTEKRIKTFKAVLRGGVKAILALCQEYKSALPFPGVRACKRA
ncbi:hypothetical protein DUNSADRAFT_11002 [Dunaliella salina]|uniref:Encoded protein n=1 Tax=Dunaliella salina TaxID=3046 RepID=A0ABQ7FS73_DUNSA|nr:hypothetical protein DUNSADRAFT_11002 [Dunaliella salina]|eukprot:KAF5825378.1 hypothetical protein DUNSADRAFT_11002 [Dunaliella salina]